MSLPYLTTAGFGFGSEVVTMTSGNANTVSFIAEEYDASEGTAQTLRNTELGAPNGALGFRERKGFRGKFQVATNSTNYPDLSDEFILPRKTTGTNFVNVTYWITDLGLPKRPRDFWSLEVTALEKA